ncbi:YceI family protein [Campylobacter gastrosuis]|uniref:YceI family protein n=1 Tax=Campylobacter gastrosuis TaxID=2974576 RepID=A0ABT7HQ55_9BACT|nr:YceI family protein [Campylobacter gastrosuis]MDL0089023.1 YceI family protein [Campylobacter gastrosuis]
MKKLIVSGLAALAILGVAQAAPFELDNAHSSVNFKIKHMGISNVNGKFNDFSAKIDASNGVLNSLEATIKTASVDTDNQKRDDHLRSADFFDVTKFSDMSFKMTEFKADKDDKNEAKITGELTLNGVTKPVKLDYEFGGATKGTDGRERIGFNLEGKIKRSDFNFANGFASDVMLGDEVKINIEVEAAAK